MVQLQRKQSRCKKIYMQKGVVRSRVFLNSNTYHLAVANTIADARQDLLRSTKRASQLPALQIRWQTYPVAAVATAAAVVGNCVFLQQLHRLHHYYVLCHLHHAHHDHGNDRCHVCPSCFRLQLRQRRQLQLLTLAYTEQ